MISLLKKFWQFCHKVLHKKNQSLSVYQGDTSSLKFQLELLKNDFAKIQKDNKVLIDFCKENLISKYKQIDTLTKLTLSHDDQIIEINNLINRNADVLNNLIMNYREHVADNKTHEITQPVSEEDKYNKNN